MTQPQVAIEYLCGGLRATFYFPKVIAPVLIVAPQSSHRIRLIRLIREPFGSLQLSLIVFNS